VNLRRVLRVVWLPAILCGAWLSPGTASASLAEFVDPNPAPGNQFGTQVVPLSTGNVVITSPFDDAGGEDAGAVYLFNGSTGALISTLRGSTAGDWVGVDGVTALSNGNYVVKSPYWHNGAAANAGAATWGSGTTGIAGVVSAANSLVGSTTDDCVAIDDGVTALSNGNYVVTSWRWSNGAAVQAGAVTWGSGTSGVAGVVSAANSLVGSTTFDAVGFYGLTALSNGNYVVRSSDWDDGAVPNSGAVTWGSGTTGVAGVISAANSLVGSSVNDRVGVSGVWELTNGNFVVCSSNWRNGPALGAGAVTWGSGTTGVTGVVSVANSLVGSTAFDLVGYGLTPLPNGNYVVLSQGWDNGATVNVGAATWGDGTTGVTGTVSAANSLVGSTANDAVGTSSSKPVTALANGNYVVASMFWNNGAVSGAGAVTWCNGMTGTTGPVSAANSLVGSTASDLVGYVVTALTNGNYVVASMRWDSGAVINAGAVTWCDGATGVTGAVSAANSLVGSTKDDNVGLGVTALSNGNYVVRSDAWNNGAVVDAGAVTWGSGTIGVAGAVTPANSLVGSRANDFVGRSGVTPLSNGNYVVRSADWDDGAITGAGAATWGSGTIGVTGAVSPANSLVGSTTSDGVGGRGVTALSNGNYVVRSTGWDSGATANVGAATWGDGTTGVTGKVSLANSLVGSTAYDHLSEDGVTALPNGDYVVAGATWDNGAFADAGAATWGSGTTGVTGVVSAASSLIGAAANTSLQGIVVDNVNDTFFGRFVDEGGGRVRVGRPNPAAVSVSDGANPVAFALEGARPNPASGGRVNVAFSLPTGAAARLELLDVSGRRVLARELGSLAPGRHTVNLAAGRRVAPGLYWVRLTHGASRQQTRVAVIE